VNAQVMVLCAGLGTRLRPLTDELPKPLVPVGDRPLLSHIAEQLARAGFSRAVVNLHHLSEIFVSKLDEIPFTFDVIEEPEIRGTAGGIAGARPRLTGSDALLVWNGDVLTEAPLVDLLEAATKTSAPALAVRPRAAGQGTVGLDGAGNVVRLRGEHFGQEVEGGDYLGICALPPESVASLPERGCLVGDHALPRLRAGRGVRALRVSPPYWFDLGQLSSYLEANLAWLAREAGADASGHRASGVVVDDGVRLSRCVLGRGVRVRGSGELRRVVAWPGASVLAPLHDAVVTSRGVVVPVVSAE
jgi:mannose-1-phosphate guanylyltransferase